MATSAHWSARMTMMGRMNVKGRSRSAEEVFLYDTVLAVVQRGMVIALPEMRRRSEIASDDDLV